MVVNREGCGRVQVDFDDGADVRVVAAQVRTSGDLAMRLLLNCYIGTENGG